MAVMAGGENSCTIGASKLLNRTDPWYFPALRGRRLFTLMLVDFAGFLTPIGFFSLLSIGQAR